MNHRNGFATQQCVKRANILTPQVLGYRTIHSNGGEGVNSDLWGDLKFRRPPA